MLLARIAKWYLLNILNILTKLEDLKYIQHILCFTWKDNKAHHQEAINLNLFDCVCQAVLRRLFLGMLLIISSDDVHVNVFFSLKKRDGKGSWTHNFDLIHTMI